MNINNNSPSFKASIPVYYYAKDKSGKIWRIMKPENIKKCNSYIIRNLTGSIKNKNENLIKRFKSFDIEYKQTGKARSVYDNEHAVVYIVTGERDCGAIQEMGQKLGEIKSESIKRTKSTKTFEVMEAARQFFKKALNYIKRENVKKKTKNGSEFSIHAVFDVLYKKNGDIKGFGFNKINFWVGNDMLNL